ncbi:hypothetical protein ACFYUK_04445 [Nonomuraea wenchangensis]
MQLEHKAVAVSPIAAAADEPVVKVWVARAEEYEEWLPGDPRLPSHTSDGKPWPRDAGAIYVKATYDLDTKDAYKKVRFSSKSNECEWSIGYSVPPGGAGKDPKTDVRRIYDLDWSPRFDRALGADVRGEDAHRRAAARGQAILEFLAAAG